MRWPGGLKIFQIHFDDFGDRAGRSLTVAIASCAAQQLCLVKKQTKPPPTFRALTGFARD